MAEIVSASIGAVLGGVVVLLWNALGSRFGEDRFWPLFQKLARDLAAGAPPKQILRQYGELLKLLAIHVGKTTCRVSIAIFPVVLSFSLFAPVASSRAMRSADHLEIYPPQSVVVTLGELSLVFGPDRRAELPRAERDAPVSIASQEFAIELPRLKGAVAVTNSTWTCLGLQLLGLNAHHRPNGPSLLMLRPHLADCNPLYPYLSDVEFWFWSGLLGASLASGLVLQVLQVKR
jgi:hypothetical protein